MKKKSFSRRDFLKLAGLATLGTATACQLSELAVNPTLGPGPIASLPPANPSLPTSTASPTAIPPTATPQPTDTVPPTVTPVPEKRRNRVLRIAHMTDFHVRPDGISTDGMARALRHAQSQADPPNVIFNTGDSIWESLGADRYQTEQQWDTFNNILASESRLPIVHAIGNHDIWGWGRSDAGMMSDPLYGKGMAIQKLGLPNRYYSFDFAGWHFIVLDSQQLTSPGASPPFMGMLDDEQYQWFVADVNAAATSTNAYICILSHMPILSVGGFFFGQNEASGNWVMPSTMMHLDARRFRDIFVQYPRIRLCLSGHIHQYESLEYLGVRFISGGAICGNWWQGTFLDFPPAYVMVNLYDDGSSDSEFVPYEHNLSIGKAIRYFMMGSFQ